VPDIAMAGIFLTRPRVSTPAWEIVLAAALERG
jgi:hypothetical protein